MVFDENKKSSRKMTNAEILQEMKKIYETSAEIKQDIVNQDKDSQDKQDNVKQGYGVGEK